MSGTQGQHHRVWNRQPVARDRAWQSMRHLHLFTVGDIVSTAEMGMDNAKKYIRGLKEAGYLITVKEKSNGHKNGLAVYRLIRNTGPKAPRLQSNNKTFDPNEHKTYNGGIQQ